MQNVGIRISAEDATKNTFDNVTRGLGGMQSAAAAAQTALASIGVGVSVGAFVRSFITLADASTNVASRLSLVTTSAAELVDVQQKLFAVAQASRVGFVDLSFTYAQLARSTKDLGVSQGAMLGIIKTISEAVTISGGSAESAKAALVQLSQGFAAGALRGEELNSVMEQTPRLAQAIAEGLGVSIGKLREMGKAGELTAAAVVGSLEKSAAGVSEEFGKMAVTVGQASTQAANSLLRLVGVVDQVTGASAGAAGGISNMSAGMEGLALNIERLSNSKGLSEFFFLALNDERSLNGEMEITQGALAKLEAQLARAPSNIYTRSAVVDMREYIKEIKEAQARLASLSGQPGPADPRDQSGFTSRGAGHAAEAARQAGFASDLNQFRLKSAGVPASYIKDTQEIIRLHQAGVLVGKEYNDALNAQQALLEKKSGATRAGSKAASDQNKELAEQAKLIAELSGMSGSFAADWDDLSAIFKRGAISLDGLTKAQAELLEKQPAIKAANDAQAKATEAIAKANLSAAEAHNKYVTSLADGLDKLRAETLAQQEQNDRLGLSKDAIAALDAAKLESQAVTLELLAIKTLDKNLDEAQYNLYKQQAAELRKLAALKGQGAAKEVAIEAADDMRKAQQKAAEESGKYWEDALMRAFESGKGFFESLWDTIKNTLKTQILKVSVQGVMGSLGLGAPGAAMAGGSGGGSLLGTASNLASLGTAIGAGVAGTVGSSIGAIFGTTAGNTALGMTMGLGTGSSLAAASAASVAGGGAAASAGLTSTAGMMSQIGTAMPYVAAALAVAAALGLFRSTKTVGQGIAGTFGDDTDLQNYTEKRKSGFLFGGPKYWKEFSEMDVAMSKQLTTTFGSVKTAAVDSAKALGLSADGITSYQKDFTLALSGDQSKDQAAISALFTGMADDMARAAAPSIAEFAKDGETASVTLQRLSTNITTANAWLHLLQNRLYNVSLSGADAASKLVDAFGGLDNLTASSKAYYEAYYTEAERTTRSSLELAKAMALVNVELPASKEAFRNVVSSLDLTTDAGRNAYAVLLALAPEYAATSEAIARLARESADKLMATFTGNGLLVPALDTTRLAIGDVTGASTVLAGELSFINSIMGDSTSAVIGFSNGAYVMGTNLSASQLSAGLLNDQIVALQDHADKARIDFAGLSLALASVNTETFVTTLSLVFENLAERISGVIGDISTERIAVREAALQIINPTVMGKAQIQAGIAGINTALPGGGSAQAASQAATQAAMAEAGAKAWLSQVSGAKGQIDTASSGVASALAASSEALAKFEAATRNMASIAPTVSVEMPGSFWDNRIYAEAANPAYTAAQQGVTAAKSAYDSASAEASRLAGVSMSTWDANKTAASQLEAATRAVSAATTVRTAADDAAKAATLAYASALQDFAIDAGKSVGKLTRLREETVKYYESQKALADLMSTSAAGLRSTVETYRYNQKTPEQQLAELQGKYSSAYITAMSVQGDGAALAGQGDKLNALLQPLIEKLNETGNSSLVSSYLAQADSVASLIEKSIPVNYQLDSLTMLGSIDATLAALDASSQSAEKIIAAAINAGADKTAAGLYAVIAAIRGQTVPAFATGGTHLGGLRIVGENGPELEATGPSRIFNANQTRAILGGSDGAMVQELRALREEVRGLRAEAQATASHTNKTARLLDRAMPDGDALATRATV